MQTAKKLFTFMAILLLSVSVAFAAMTSAQSKEKFEQGLPVCEVLELAIISGSPLGDVYTAAETATVPDGSSVDQLKAQITTCAVTSAAAQVDESSSPLSVLTISQVVEASIAAGVPLTVALNAAATPEVQNQVAAAAVALATPVVADDGTTSTPVITLQEVADAMLATGTAEADLSASLASAGATTEQIATVVVYAAPNVAMSVVDEPQKNECDTSVSPAAPTGGGCP